MFGWWVLLVAAGMGALIGIGVFFGGVFGGEPGAGVGGFFLSAISGFLVYLSLINIFFPGLPLGPSVAHKDAGKPTPATCGLKYVYDSLADMGTSWSVKFSTSAQNNTPSPTTATFRSNVDTTVSVTDSLGLTVTGGASLITIITASVKTSINASVTESIHLQVGVDEQYVVPPNSTANANYGVKVQVVGGHLYTTKDSCNQISWGRVITYIPISSGWCVWLNSETPCPTISS